MTDEVGQGQLGIVPVDHNLSFICNSYPTTFLHYSLTLFDLYLTLQSTISPYSYGLGLMVQVVRIQANTRSDPGRPH
jgi:hypothetical protein